MKNSMICIRMLVACALLALPSASVLAAENPGLLALNAKVEELKNDAAKACLLTRVRTFPLLLEYVPGFSAPARWIGGLLVDAKAIDEVKQRILIKESVSPKKGNYESDYHSSLYWGFLAGSDNPTRGMMLEAAVRSADGPNGLCGSAQGRLKDAVIERGKYFEAHADDYYTANSEKSGKRSYSLVEAAQDSSAEQPRKFTTLLMP